MNGSADRAAALMTTSLFTRFPLDAARLVERAEAERMAPVVREQPVAALRALFGELLPETAAPLLLTLPDKTVGAILAGLPSSRVIRILGFLDAEEQARLLGTLEPSLQRDFETLLSYPPNTAGSIMDVAVPVYRREQTVGEALKHLKKNRMKTARSLFLVDDEHRLVGKISLQDLILESRTTRLADLAQPVRSAVRPVDPIEEVSEAFEFSHVLDLPVIDIDGIFLGAVMHDSLAQTVHEEAAGDLQAMVGASRDERALSSPLFTVKKRMPWLQINLLTAFLAASVVGLFEQTIAQVTALAVLLPVVAGQSGNAGAQALAVTMRGLALREITARQWLRVMRKEVVAGLLNGIAIAITCGIGVYFWSQSVGLVAVIASAMVLAMIAAGFAGAVIPIMLTRLGQDPATSSSIILTTVTDVAGFFSFLGIATALMQFL
ncbi:MAG: magnesium transporter [Woeseiaceae bacterium]|nr:magnesium transporter [Woeseiaceae bacterium]